MDSGKKVILGGVNARSLLRSLLSLAVGVALIAFLFRKMEVHNLREVIREASRGMLLLSAVALCGFYSVRAFRWAVILKWRVSPAPLFLYSSIAYLISSVLPPQIGELLRPAFLRTRHGMPYFFALASVAVERLLDVASLFLLAFAALVILPTRPAGADWLLRALRTAGICTCLLMFTLVIVVLRSTGFMKGVSRLLSLLHLPSRIVQGTEGIARSVLEGSTVIASPLYLSLAMICSLVIWSMNAGSVILVFRALGMDFHAGAIILGFAIVSLGLVIPLTPAYVGQYEALWVLVFLALGAHPKARVLEVGLVAHSLFLLVIALLGLLSLGILAWSKGGKQGEATNEIELRVN